MFRVAVAAPALVTLVLLLSGGCGSSSSPPETQQVFDAPTEPTEPAAPGTPAVDPADDGSVSSAPPSSAEDLALAAEPMAQGVTSSFSVVPDMDKSTLSFVSTKNGSTEVGGKFGVVLGGFDIDPQRLSSTTGVLNVELDSVDTGLPLRDANLAETFFGRVVGKVIRSDVEFLAFRPEAESVAVGGKTLAEVDLRINLRGHGNLATAKVELARTQEQGWTLRTTEPVALSIEGLGMQGRADSLKERCGHQSIGDAVTISAEIVLAPPK
jgi:polyisoprenoid-binding protein YceI